MRGTRRGWTKWQESALVGAVSDAPETKRLSDKTRARLRSVASWVGLLVVLFAIRACQKHGTASGAAPAVRAETLSGDAVELSSFRGDVVAVHFWATWCGVCAAEQSNIDSLSSGGRVLTIASASGSRSDVARYVREHEITAPVIVDQNGALARAYGVSAYPTTFYVGPDGKIRFVEVGYTTTLGMRARLAFSGLGL